MSGYSPITDIFGHRVTQWPGIARIAVSSFTASNTSGLSRKVQLLELCARIGYTPHTSSSQIDFDPSNALLEDYPCHNNMLS